jgi:hypothetical protein
MKIAIRGTGMVGNAIASKLGPDEPPESFAHIASDWSVAEQSALRQHRGRPRVRRACEARRLLNRSLPKTCSTASSRSSPAECRAPRHAFGVTRTSRCTASWGADEDSPEAGRRRSVTVRSDASRRLAPSRTSGSVRSGRLSSQVE